MIRTRHIAAALIAALALAGCIGGGEDVCISPVPTPNACPGGGEVGADKDASEWGGGEPTYTTDTGGTAGGADAQSAADDAGKHDPNAGAVDGDGDASGASDALGQDDTGAPEQCGDAASDGECGADATLPDDADEPVDDALQEDAE